MAKKRSQKKPKTEQTPEIEQKTKVKFIKIPLPLLVNISIGLFLGLVISVLALYLILTYLFAERIYPGISISKVDISGLTKAQAVVKIKQNLDQRLNNSLNFNQSQSLLLNNLQNDLDVDNQVNLAFELGHVKPYFPITNLDLNLTDQTKIDQKINELAKVVDKPPLESEIKLSGEEINVTPSEAGYIIDQPQLKKELLIYINTHKKPSALPMMVAQPKLPYQKALLIKNRLDQIKLQPLLLTFKEENKSFKLDLKTILPLLDLQNQPNYFESKKLSDYIGKIASEIDRPVQEPLFAFEPSLPNKVQEFSPPIPGRKLDQNQLEQKLAQALQDENIKEIELPIETVNPKNKLTNELGIKEQIGEGYSNFAGSIDNRIFNLKLATARLNGVLIAPGETFSFLETVGDISAATGYKQAYVIKSGRTVLDDGGGVCQISTTLFRAALDAGLPIVSRTAHAYRVHYYENNNYPAGIDATIYSPGVDFKFKNDTPNHILIQAKSQGLDLYINIYGTWDGRVTTISKPVVTNRTPAPPDLRQDDPTLPKGTVKQVDWAVEGANVSFKRTVTRNGEIIINDTFKSNYRPWQAVYLVGTKEG